MPGKLAEAGKKRDGKLLDHLAWAVFFDGAIRTWDGFSADSWDFLAIGRYRVAIFLGRADFHHAGSFFLLVAQVEGRVWLDHEKPPVW
jgi:hypothetical protein